MGKYTLYKVGFKAKRQGKMVLDIVVPILYSTVCFILQYSMYTRELKVGKYAK